MGIISVRAMKKIFVFAARHRRRISLFFQDVDPSFFAVRFFAPSFQVVCRSIFFWAGGLGDPVYEDPHP